MELTYTLAAEFFVIVALVLNRRLQRKRENRKRMQQALQTYAIVERLI